MTAAAVPPRLILNGKKAGVDAVRAAVASIRAAGTVDGAPSHAIAVRFAAVPGELRLALPNGCPCITQAG